MEKQEIVNYVKKRSFLDRASLAKEIVCTMAKDKLVVLKRELKARANYLEDMANFSPPEDRAICEDLAERTNDLLLTIQFEEKLSFESNPPGRRKKASQSATDLNARRKLKHDLKGIDTLEQLDSALKEAKKIKNTRLITARMLRDLRKKPHLQQASGEFEWFSPPAIIEKARSVMGSIDLDPASNEEANKIVQASQIYTAKEDGLKQDWTGNLWLNPPFKKGLIDEFIEKLLSSKFNQAVVLVNNNTETKWGQAILNKGEVVCFPAGRLNFWKDSKEPYPKTGLQGQMIIGLRVNVSRFIQAFKEIGVCTLLFQDHFNLREMKPSGEPAVSQPAG